MKTMMMAIVCMCMWLPAQVKPAKTQSDLLFPNSDFESGTLENWTAKGDAFSNQPTKGDNAAARHGQPARLQGDYYVGTYENYSGQPGQTPGSVRGDQATGELLSIPFEIKHPLIAFLLSGGHHIEREYVALLIDGKVVKKEMARTGETMETIIWNVKKYIGKQAQILIKDDWAVPESWGHINVDYFHYLAIDGASLFDLTPSER